MRHFHFHTLRRKIAFGESTFTFIAHHYLHNEANKTLAEMEGRPFRLARIVTNKGGAIEVFKADN